MYINVFDAKLTPRTDGDAYPLQMNEAIMNILSLIFELKVLTVPQISRFLNKQDESKYLYLKLRRMWQAGLLESFKIYTGSSVGMPVYYMLSKRGLKLLKEQGKYHPNLLKVYPHPKALFSWNMFRHEAQIAELASQEAKNGSSSFSITFKGEAMSQVHEARSDKNIEVFTPDYTVFYRLGQNEHCIYTEFERTDKSHTAMGRKLERYLFHLDDAALAKTTIRFIFQHPAMEQAFWTKLCLDQSRYLQSLRILSTNLTLLSSHEQFLEPIYTSDDTVKLHRQGRVIADISARAKLLSFL